MPAAASLISRARSAAGAVSASVRSRLEARQPSTGVLDEYVHGAPNAQQPFDVFDGEWSSAVPPGPLGHVTTGITPLFDDPRIHWAGSVFGGFKSMRALELGPLEGGHSAMLQRAGAESVDAIEANTRAYLKCLVVKEHLGLDRVRFHLGDLMSFVRDPAASMAVWHGDDRGFDVVIASGVLYHMQDPVELIAGLAKLADRVFIWTQYLDPDRLDELPSDGKAFGPLEEREHAGFTYTSALQTYGPALGWGGFCGGPEHHSRWLTRDSLFGALRHFGFEQIDVSPDHDEPDHPNGPAIALCASKS